MKRILHIINGEHYSGAERVQDLLAMHMPAHGMEIGFVCVKPVKFPAYRKSHTPLYEIPMRSRFDTAVSKKVSHIVHDKQYHLIHAHTPRAALIGRMAARICKVPLVYHVHSPARYDTDNRLRNWLNATSERFTVKNAAAFIAVSQSMKDYMKKEGFAEERIHVVPNGVAVGKPLLPWHPARSGSWNIGMVALFRPRKGLEILLESLAQLRGQGMIVTLHAVGPFESEEYKSYILNYTARLGLNDAIRWVGYTQNVQDEFSQMDIFVLPSLYGEGLPMVLLEAMAAGIPIIAADVEGVSQALRHEVDGVVVKPGNADSLISAISDVIRGRYPIDVMRQSAQERQQKEFSDIRMVESVADIYRKVLGC